MKVYILSYEDVNIDFCNSFVKVFKTKKLAIKEFESYIKDINDNIDSYEYMTIEENVDSFEMYENGRYSENHIFIKIEEKEVIDNE